MQFLIRRIGFYLVAAFIAIILNFMIPRMMTGDPITALFARFQGRLDPNAIEALRETFGLVDAPLHEQFFTYLGSLFQGNLGISLTAFPAPVTEVIGTGLWWTLRLAGIATIISFFLGTLLGVFAAWRRGRFADTVILPTLSFIGAFPYFWVAMLCVYGLAFKFGWFPLSHAYDLSLPVDWGSGPFLWSVIYHAALPTLTIVVTGIGGWMLAMRNNMIGVLSEDYIVMAQAKGLSDRRVMLTYAARNAILPSVTGFAMSLGFAIGGALLTEIVFSYPGVGFWLLSAVNARDYPLMQGIFMIITMAVLLANFLADVVYVLLDPRAR
ncbi:MAG: ABC transporter permease [Burkholderiales bacterium]|nr:ABC transporter permease [Anaerolineae bacterium]